MRSGLARFRRGADRNHGAGPRVAAGQHPKYALLRGSFVPNEPLQIARGPRAFAEETHLQTREVRAHLDGSQPVGSSRGWNSIGPNAAFGNAQGSRAFVQVGPTAITGQAPVGGGATSEIRSLEGLVCSE